MPTAVNTDCSSMANDYVSITIRIDPDLQEIVMAGLYELGFEAFVEEETGLQAFIPESMWGPEKKSETRSLLGKYDLGFAEELLEDKDWNEQWESNFNDILLGGKLQIRAPFHKKDHRASDELIIAPKMAFGTGHHSTTSMILEWMMTQDFSGKKVLDFGCGTGILGIYALKKGAESVLFIDNEHEAVENTRENALLNSLDPVEAVLGSSEKIPSVSYDVILANITRNVLTELMDDLKAALKPDGKLVISGFLEQDKSYMLDFLTGKDLVVLEVLQNQDWLAMVLTHE